jgi:NAD(P)-dependent dehydrogenase (short-subunit alcohol dehydrogenase family)
MMMRFDGRVAVVTGAGQGLGRAHALLLASRGAAVVVNDPVRDDGRPRAESVRDEIRAVGGVAVANRDSVASPAGGERIVQAALEEFGRVDIVVNNAGIVRDRAFHNLTDDDVNDVLGVHLGGAFWVTRAAWPHLRANRYGRVVMTTSLSGLIGNFGQANYAAAKMGVVGLTRVLAAEGERRGITVNAIAPLAQTEMATQLDAFDVTTLSPERVANVVGYLAHESCTVSGDVFSVMGGRVARYFVGLTPGVRLEESTPETVAEAIADVRDRGGYIEPRTLADEIDWDAR